MNHVTIYARKSTESEDKQVMSIESQVKELKAHAKRMNWIVDRVLTESKSAKAPGRPVFNQLYEYMEQNKLNELLCWKLDRLARNPVDGGALIWAMEENKLTHIHTPQRSFFNSGNDKFWLQLEFGMAKKYIDDLSDNVKRGLKAKLEKGWYPTQAPLGYKNKLEDHTIIPDPKRFNIIRKMWDLILTGGYTVPQVLDIGNNKFGLRSRMYRSGGGNPISRSTIYYIFSNPFYYGMFEYHGKLYTGNHKPMVTKKEFDKVQSIIHAPITTRPKQYTFQYTGLMRCGECGASVTAEHKTNRFGSKYVYYHCTKRKTTCSQKYIQEEQLNDQFESFMNLITYDQFLLEFMLKISESQQDPQEEDNKMEIASLKKRIAHNEKNTSELLTIKLRGLLNDADFLSKKQELEKERELLGRRIKNAIEGYDKAKNETIDTFRFMTMLRKTFTTGTIEEKKGVVRDIGSNLILLDKKLLIEAKEPYDIIFNHIESIKPYNIRFEPLIHGLPNGKNPALNEAISKTRGLVDEVRTFYLNSDSCPQSGGSSG
ncbi:MAG: recombinase family protein [Candidatus Zixiibacteriota bacterium]